MAALSQTLLETRRRWGSGEASFSLVDEMNEHRITGLSQNRDSRGGMIRVHCCGLGEKSFQAWGDERDSWHPVPTWPHPGCFTHIISFNPQSRPHSHLTDEDTKAKRKQPACSASQGWEVEGSAVTWDL